MPLACGGRPVAPVGFDVRRPPAAGTVAWCGGVGVGAVFGCVPEADTAGVPGRVGDGRATTGGLLLDGVLAETLRT